MNFKQRARIGLRDGVTMLGLALGVVGHAGFRSGERPVKGQHKQIEFVEGEYVVQFQKGQKLSRSQMRRSLGPAAFALKEIVNEAEGVVLVSTSRKATPKAILARLAQVPGVDFGEPNFIFRALDVERLPNETRFGELWAMKNLGQPDAVGQVGKVGADIKAPAAWSLNTGSRRVVVAVIDTGVDYTHPDLAPNIWTKPGTTGVHGFNAVTGVTDPMDDNNHGTHCSGTIGAVGDNTEGVVGVNWQVSIMGAKFLKADGSGTLADSIKAIDWARENGAQIMSSSWGGGGYAQTLYDAIARTRDAGILFVAAAGNDSSNNDAQPSYPASFDLENIVSVAASTNQDSLAIFSNFGAAKVHLMAPGDQILSTVIGGKYASYSGTSMATPHVAGAAALLLSAEPQLKFGDIKARLMSSSDKSRAFRRRVMSAGRLNIFNLLAGINPPAPVSPPESAWAPAEAFVASTPHPYTDNYRARFEISKEGAKFLRVHFAKFDTESGYDIVRILDGAGNEVDSLSGTLPDGTWTSEIEGSKVIIDFKADGSLDKNGFDIDSFSWTNFDGQERNEAF